MRRGMRGRCCCGFQHLDLGGQQVGTLRVKGVKLDMECRLDSHAIAGEAIATPRAVDVAFDMGSTHLSGDRSAIGISGE
jgi:hypothetical protein